jgi:hypothetical protein
MDFDTVHKKLIAEAEHYLDVWHRTWVPALRPNIAVRELRASSFAEIVPYFGKNLGIQSNDYYPKLSWYMRNTYGPGDVTVKAEEFGPYSDGSGPNRTIELCLHDPTHRSRYLRFGSENAIGVYRWAYAFDYAETGYEGHDQVYRRDPDEASQLARIISQVMGWE